MILLLSISEIVFLGSRKVFIKSAKITTNERNVDAFVCCVELKKPNGPLTPKSPFGRIFYIFAIAAPKYLFLSLYPKFAINTDALSVFFKGNGSLRASS